MTMLQNLVAAGDVVIDPHNERIRVLAYARDSFLALHQELCEEAEHLGLGKIIVYGRQGDGEVLASAGYRQEGQIDGFFQGEHAYMHAFFLHPQRGVSAAAEAAEQVLQLSLAKSGTEASQELPEGYRLRAGTSADADQLASLYKTVFATYPTPMDDPGYIRKTMEESTYYYVVTHGEQIICAASAEVTPRFGSAELTDCATHPDHLGKGLLQPLFAVLEEVMRQQGIFYLYSLTRAQSPGMNVTVAKSGYQYRGRLINNCKIYSGFEDMNIWVKALGPLKE